MVNIKKHKFAFFGTPELVIPILEELEQNNLTPSLIVTGKDVPIGRKLIITPPPAKLWGESRNIPVWQPDKIDSEFVNKFKKENIDLGIVVAYGKILPQELISTPKFGMINVHYSLLPKYRGATPVESAILNNEKETGVSIQQMIYRLDAGDVLDEEKIEIKENETAPELRTKLNEVAKKILPRTIEKIISGVAAPYKQNEDQSTHCTKIKKQDGLINLKEDGLKNYLKYRAYFGWPGTYFFIKSGDKEIRVKITSAKFVDGKFEIEKVIPEGKNEMSYSDFLRGKNLASDSF